MSEIERPPTARAPRRARALETSLARATAAVAAAGGLVVVATLAVEMPGGAVRTSWTGSPPEVESEERTGPATVESRRPRRAPATSDPGHDAAAHRVLGAVSRADGAELGPVTVRAIAVTADLLDRLDQSTGLHVDELLALAHDAPAGPTGAFAIPVPEPGAYAIVAAGPRIAPAFGAAETDGTPVALVAAPGERLRGLVVDGKGAPVAHAAVAVIHPRGPASEGAPPEERIARAAFALAADTDDAGAFDLSGLDGGPFTLLASAPGHASAKLLDLVPSAGLVRVTLHSASTVTGRVLDERQRPIRGATVAVARSLGPGALDESGDTVTDARGAYELSDVASGGHALVMQVAATGFATRRVTMPPLRPGEARVQPIALESAADLRVRVVDAEGRPLPGALVEVYGLCDGALLGGRTTDAEGRTRVEGCSLTRSYRVMAKAPGHCIGTVAEADASRVVEVRLEPSYSLRGWIVNEAGLPQAGTVRARRDNDREVVIDEREVAADATGAFRFDDLPPGPVTLVVDAPDHATADVGPLVVGRDMKEVSVRLERGVTWTGRLVDAAGAPISGARVRNPEMTRATGRARGGRGPCAVSDARGAFEIPRVPAGAAGVIVEREGAAPAFLRVTETAAPSPTRDVGVLRLDGTAALRGVVLDGRGQPIEGAAVSLAGGLTVDAAAPAARTSADGSFLIAGVSPGRYALDVVDPAASAMAGGFRRKTLEVELVNGEVRDVVVDARSDARVRGRLRVSGAAPASPTEVALCWSDGSGREVSAAEVDLDGGFELTAPRAGTYSLEVRSLDGPVFRGAGLVTLRERETRETTIELGQSVISGRVVSKAGGEPVASARIEIETEQGARWPIVANADGTFRVGGLPQGTVRVRALARGYAIAPPQDVRLHDRQAATASFELSPEAVVTVSVTDSEKAVVAGARVAAWMEDGTFVGDEVSDAQGRAALRALPGCKIVVVVEHASFARKSETLAVAPVARLELAVELQRVATVVTNLRDEKGLPAAFVEVFATAPGGAVRVGSTDERGMVRFDFTAAGLVGLRAAGFTPRNVQVQLGHTTQVSLPK